jgi:hypothetical protein
MPIIPQKVNQLTVAPLPEQVMLSGMPQQNLVMLTPHPTAMPGMHPPIARVLTPPPSVQLLTPPPEVPTAEPKSSDPFLFPGPDRILTSDQEHYVSTTFLNIGSEPDPSSSGVKPDPSSSGVKSDPSSSGVKSDPSPISKDQSPIQESFPPLPINSLWISLSLTMRSDTEKITVERRWNITPTPKMAVMDTAGSTPEESPKPIPKITPTEVIGDLTEIMPDEEHQLRGPDDPILRLFVSEPLLPPDTSQINNFSTQDEKNQTMGFLKDPKNVFKFMKDFRHCTLTHGVHTKVLDDLTEILAAGSPYLTAEGLKAKTEEE